MEATVRAAYAYVATALEEYLPKNTPAIAGVDHEVRMLIMMFERHAATGTTLGEAIAHRLELDDEGRELLAELKNRRVSAIPPNEVKEACRRFHDALITILRMSESESPIALVAAEAVSLEPILVATFREIGGDSKIVNAENERLWGLLAERDQRLTAAQMLIATLEAKVAELVKGTPQGDDAEAADVVRVGPNFIRSHSELGAVCTELADYLGVSTIGEIVPAVKKLASELQDLKAAPK